MCVCVENAVLYGRIHASFMGDSGHVFLYICFQLQLPPTCKQVYNALARHREFILSLASWIIVEACSQQSKNEIAKALIFTSRARRPVDPFASSSLLHFGLLSLLYYNTSYRLLLLILPKKSHLREKTLMLIAFFLSHTSAITIYIAKKNTLKIQIFQLQMINFNAPAYYNLYIFALAIL